jgi:hypothetical protein
MDEGGVGLLQPGPFAVGQVDGVAEDGAGAHEAEAFVGVEVVARLGEELGHPGAFVGLFRKVGLHQAVRVFGPECTHRLELVGRRGGREARRDRVGQPAPPVPSGEERAAVVVGGYGGVPEALWRVAVHAGLARHGPEPARHGRLEEGVDAFGVNRAVACDGGRPMGEDEVEVPLCRRARVGRIAEAHLLREGVGLEPVDEPLAPARDDPGLGIVDMGVHEARQDEAIPVVGDRNVWMCLAKAVRGADAGEEAVLDEHGAATLVPRRDVGRDRERVRLEGEGLAEKQTGVGHVGSPPVRVTLVRGAGIVNRCCGLSFPASPDYCPTASRRRP